MPREQQHPPQPLDIDPTDWGAFKSKEGFEIAELAYHKAHMSEGNIDNLFKICSGRQVPFSNHNELYAAIDGITARGVPWQSFSIKYRGMYRNNSDVPQPKWMLDTYKIFYHDPWLIVHEMLANPDFKDGINFAPYYVFDKDGICRYQHLISGDWAWEQVVSFPTSLSY